MAQAQRSAGLATSQPPIVLPEAHFFHEPEFLDSASMPVLQVAQRPSSHPSTPPAADTPRPPLLAARTTSGNQEKKMHQTSTRIMRTNPDGRPFACDFHDLFSTLMVSLNIGNHKSRFRTYPYSFTTEDAVNNLANLKFAQSNRMPDPNDVSRVVTTTTTTTFSMAKDMAKALCQRFIDAHFFECASDKHLDTFKDKSIWTLTPKGICKLGRFVMRNGISVEHVTQLVASKLNTMQLIILERDSETDAILQDRSIIEIIFRRFAGRTPNVAQNASEADSSSSGRDGMTGVALAELRRVADQQVRQSFNGRSAIAWLTDCTTVLDQDEAHDLAEMFVSQNLISYVGDARGKSGDSASSFKSLKSSIYVITPKGRRVACWDTSNGSSDGSQKQSYMPLVMNRKNSQSTASSAKPHSSGGSSDERIPRLAELSSGGSVKETNTNRLNLILGDPALRSQFRAFLVENYSEENLSFYLDVIDFVRQINTVKALDGASEGLAKAYSIYNAYLAAGSPCELNLDHQLRLEMAAQMTQAVESDEGSMYQSLAKVAELYDRAQKQVFRLMAGDSVPKFLKTSLYLELVGDYGSDQDDD